MVAAPTPTAPVHAAPPQQPQQPLHMPQPPQMPQPMATMQLLHHVADAAAVPLALSPPPPPPPQQQQQQQQPEEEEEEEQAAGAAAVVEPASPTAAAAAVGNAAAGIAAGTTTNATGGGGGGRVNNATEFLVEFVRVGSRGGGAVTCAECKRLLAGGGRGPGNAHANGECIDGQYLLRKKYVNKRGQKAGGSGDGVGGKKVRAWALEKATVDQLNEVIDKHRSGVLDTVTSDEEGLDEESNDECIGV